MAIQSTDPSRETLDQKPTRSQQPLLHKIESMPFLEKVISSFLKASKGGWLVVDDKGWIKDNHRIDPMYPVNKDESLIGLNIFQILAFCPKAQNSQQAIRQFMDTKDLPSCAVNIALPINGQTKHVLLGITRTTANMFNLVVLRDAYHVNLTASGASGF